MACAMWLFFIVKLVELLDTVCYILLHNVYFKMYFTLLPTFFNTAYPSLTRKVFKTGISKNRSWIIYKKSKGEIGDEYNVWNKQLCYFTVVFQSRNRISVFFISRICIENLFSWERQSRLEITFSYDHNWNN